MRGIHTALITPFNDLGDLDEEGLRLNILFQMENLVDGVVLLGTTAENPTLSFDEKESIVKIAVSEAKGKVSVGVGTGSNNTREAVRNTRLAQEWGADYAMVVSPYYNRPTQEGLYLHFKEIAESVDMPILLYNIAGRTGVNIQTETLKRLADIPNIVGVKDASGSVAQMMDVIHVMSTHRPDFAVFSGDDMLTLPLMALGGQGVISVVSNLLPQRIKSLTDALIEGNFDSAREIHYSLLPIFKVAFIETNPMPIKYAMNLWGMAAGNCRMPLCELLDESKEKLKQCLMNYEAFRPSINYG